MTEVEMLSAWWQYAAEAAGVARQSIEEMHPFEREVHDLTVEDCTETEQKIKECGALEAEKWATVDLTDRDVLVLWQGVTDLAFRERDETPDHYLPATRWSNANKALPDVHHRVVEALPST